MRLDHLHLQNFRCYEDARFDFQPGFNLVVGVNGSGKTSLLQGVATSLIDFTNATNNFYTPLPEDIVRLVTNSFETRQRFERCYPLILEATGDFDEIKSWTISKSRDDGASSSDRLLHKAITKRFDRLGENKNSDLPVVAFYRANRQWIITDLSAESAITQKHSRLYGHKNWSHAALSMEDIESWVIAKMFERLEGISLFGKPELEEDELSLVNLALRIALPGTLGIRYNVKLRTLMLDMSNDTSIRFQDLSDGQRGFVALFIDIARRICILNPQMGSKALINTSGVILIDELDIHLHPAWQRNIAPALKKAFPKVQFIATSHSPQVIGSLQPEEVILLHNGDSSHPTATYGLDSSSILEAVMGVEQRLPEIEELLNEMFTSLENNKLEKARQQLKALKKKAPDLPEYAGAEALLRRKEIIGR